MRALPAIWCDDVKSITCSDPDPVRAQVAGALPEQRRKQSEGQRPARRVQSAGRDQGRGLKSKLRRQAIFCIVLLLLAWPGAARAQDVALTSHDGLVTVEGTLLSFDGEFYRVRTEYGPLTLDGSSVSCAGPGCPEPGAHVARLRVIGSPTLGARLFPRLLEGFAGQEGLTVRRIMRSDTDFAYELIAGQTGQPVARFTFDLGPPDGDGLAELAGGGADMLLSAGPVFGADTGGQPDHRARVLALDALVPVVSLSNPVDVLGSDALRAVLRGETGNWSAFGGADAPITLHLPHPQSDPGHGFPFLLPDDKPNKPDAPPATVFHADPAALSDAVARDPFALGLARWSETGSAKPLRITGTCGFDLPVTAAALRTGDYPFSAPMFLYTPARRLPKPARAFLRFLELDAAQRIVARAGFADSRIARTPLSAQGGRLANAIARAGSEVPLSELQRMVGVLSKGARLTPTFRFQPGSSRPDSQAHADLRRIALLIEAGTFDGGDLLLAGFSDGEGDADANRRIAERRAIAVRDALAEMVSDMGRVTLSTDGFGEAMPIACDDSDWGRRVNRRVELWLRPAQR